MRFKQGSVFFRCDSFLLGQEEQDTKRCHVFGLFNKTHVAGSVSADKATSLSVQMYGRVNFLLGYTSHDVYKAFLNLTDSSWVKISASPVRSGEVVMLQENRM